MPRNLVFIAAAWAFCVVMAGAYVRGSDAGLGCPDWPGCYGQIVGVPDAQKPEAAAAFPGRPLTVEKARKEVFHRYLAGTLGLLILGIAALSWRKRKPTDPSPWLATALVAIVALQAALGMWTVTLQLRPMVVSLHLLGGMTTLALLVWLAMGAAAISLPAGTGQVSNFKLWAQLGLAVLALQIALGGWVSANYAGLACNGFPLCRGAWAPAADFGSAFHLQHELGFTAGGQFLSNEALTAIHWTHRAGALITFLYLGALGAALARVPSLRRFGIAVLILLALQIALGIGLVTLDLPLFLAVAHNGGAALLLVTLVMLNFVLHASARRELSTALN